MLTTVAPTSRWRIPIRFGSCPPVLVCAVVASGLTGCSASDSESKEKLNWQNAESALKSPHVKTIRDFYIRLGTESTSERKQKWYSDLAKREADFDPLEQYIANNYQESEFPGITPERAKKMLANEMTWKNGEQRPVDQIVRTYLEGMHRPVLDQLANWDALVYVTVFTDSEGLIIGWVIVE